MAARLLYRQIEMPRSPFCSIKYDICNQLCSGVLNRDSAKCDDVTNCFSQEKPLSIQTGEGP